MELLLNNNVPAEEQVKDPVRFIGTKGYKVLVVGNSITLHAPKPVMISCTTRGTNRSNSASSILNNGAIRLASLYFCRSCFKYFNG